MSEPRIWILPAEVAERIAAGEVVERPASVVKELVENALDAGARRVAVETERGGKALIRVADDGQGMTNAEACLALQRHATSKLRSVDDLFRIRTLGFRGEALPSIAAVSRMEILTRTPDAEEGTRLLTEGGVIRACEAAAAPVGTTITVQELFYNVPVRFRFLRSDAAEGGAVTDWLQRLALSRPDVSFRLIHDGREALLSPGSQDPLNAVVALFGRAVARDLLLIPMPETEPRPPAPSVAGFVGRPTLTRANRALQHTYVNGRAVRSPLFYRGIDDAYRATMPQGRFPVVLLFLSVPPDRVDVNVHPAKVEVRLQDEGAVQSALVTAIRSALRPSSQASGSEERAERLPFAEATIVGAGDRHPPSPSRFAPRVAERQPAPGQIECPSRGPRHPLPGPPPQGKGMGAGDRFGPPLPGPTPQGEGTAIPPLTLLGQAQDLFILAEGGGQLWVIDQHVAHERILFDRLTANSRVSEPPQPLLINTTLEVDAAQALALEEHREPLARLGFTVEPFGPGRYTLRGVPRALIGRNYETVFRDLADELTEQSQGGRTRLPDEELAAVAAGRSCKRAVKAGQALSRQEIEELLRELRSTRNPYTCPHGRPVFLAYDRRELAALFGRQSCDAPPQDSGPGPPLELE